MVCVVPVLQSRVRLEPVESPPYMLSAPVTVTVWFPPEKIPAPLWPVAVFANGVPFSISESA